MNVYTLDPLRDPRWNEFIRHDPRSSVFHTTEWLQALARTYGYESVVYTTTPPGKQLTNGIVFCRISSWFSGRRLVSLPFSDHCEPLVDSSETLHSLLLGACGTLEREGWKYMELRPLLVCGLNSRMDVREYQKFCWHSLDVRADVETLHQKFHSCIQRPIQRADRECLSYEQGDSDRLLRSFYDLLLLTRRRHQLLPQPLAWFRNLVACLGNKLSIHVASKNGHAIAAMLTLLYGKSLVYKYGSSDARFHNLGAMPFLFWKAIQNGKEVGADHFDLGRSDLENVGLQAFKDHLGATRAVLKYYRYPPCAFEIEKSRWSARIARQVCSRLPGPVLSALGKIMYKHAG